jgi:hypothetical protein
MGLFNQLTQRVNTRFGNYIAGLLANQSQTELVARQNAATTALNYYEGNYQKQLTTRAGEPDDNVFINYAEFVVEAGVDFLFGEDLGIEIGDDKEEIEADGGETPAEAKQEETAEDYLDSIWPEEQRAEDFIDLATEGAIHGDGWMKIVIDENGDPYVAVLDPNNMTADTDPDNYRKVLAFRCQYPTIDATGRKILFKEETTPEGKGWVIRQYDSYDDGQTWTKRAEETQWSYPFAPVFHCKNLPKAHSYYGKSDLPDHVLSVIKYISRTDSLKGRIVRAHAAPKPIAKGMEKQDLQLSTTGVLFLGTNPDAKVELLEMKGELTGALEFRKQLREGLAEVTRVPEIASGKVENLGQLSGLALKILYGPLIKRTNKKRRLYGRLIKEVIAALVVIGKFGEQPVKLHWGDPLPQDPQTAIETAVGKKQLGYSNDTLIQETGGDPDLEKKKRAEEDQNLGDGLLNAFEKGQTGGSAGAGIGA